MTNKCLVIFGATGDLTQRKLLPALWNGFLHHRLIETKIIGIGRREWSTAQFRKIAQKACKPTNAKKWAKFEQNLCYHKMDFNEEKGYAGLAAEVAQCTNAVYFLATPPEAFPIIAKHLSKVKINGNRRLVVEKPFGKDLKTAEKLNREIKKYFGDEIYRIDHYLGKNIMRNILTLRFSNEVFKAVWNKSHISHVEISHLETLGVETRRDFYDATGAIRDVLQSHLLQMLALIAMKQPKNNSSLEIYKQKSKVLESLIVPEPSNVIIGQYKGYEKEIGRPSQTETLVALKIFVNDVQWKGIPFYLTQGKKLEKRSAKIVVNFKKPLFAQDELPNTLCITIEPEEHITFQLNIRQHDKQKIKPFVMDYCESCETPNTPQAYEKLLIDVFNGDKTLFTSWREIRASWKFTDALLKKLKGAKLYKYAPGSKPPEIMIEKEK